ncbi:hypothetical protein BH23CHL2_BH23CHL2_05700 [soil metagenome]
MPRFASRRLLLLWIVIGAQLVTALLARSAASLWLVGAPWLIGLAAAVILVHGPAPRLRRSGHPARKRELWVVVALTALAGLLRLPRLESLPAGIYGDEGEFGSLALAISRGQGPEPFGVAFLGDPALYVHVLAPFVSWLGPTMEAIRLPSALVGTATVPLFYGLVRHLYGRFVALLAAFFLATSAVHIHFSRLALNVIWVPFFTCLSLWLLKRGLDERKDVWFLLAGIAGGVGFYFHFGARLIIPILIAILISQSLVNRRDWRIWVRATGFIVLGAFLALSPFLSNLSNNPELLTDHTNKRGIWNHWHDLADRYDTVASDKTGILWEQVRRTFFAFTTEPDSRYGAFMYRFMDQPLLPTIIAVLAISGVVALSLRWRSDAARITLIWLTMPCIFASILTDVAGQAHRLLNPMLAALIAAALVIDAGRRFLWPRLPVQAAVVAVTCILLVPLIAGFRDSYDYIQSGATMSFGVPATAQARCLEALPAGTLALIDGAPRIYARHGPSRYLAADVVRKDLDDASEDIPDKPQQVVILVHEWNRSSAESILSAYPNGSSVEIQRPEGRRALTVIAIDPDERAAASVLQACRQNADA